MASDANRVEPVASDVPAPEQPERTVDPEVAAPGGEITVLVRTPLQGGRTILREVCPVSAQTVEAVEPDPTTVAAANGSIFVAWDTPEETVGTLRYTCRLPPGPTADTYDWAGTLVAPGGGTVVGGVQEVVVVASFVDRLLADESIDDQQLETAAVAFEDGHVSEERFRQVVEHWRRSAPPEPERSPPEPEPSETKSWLPW